MVEFVGCGEDIGDSDAFGNSLADFVEV